MSDFLNYMESLAAEHKLVGHSGTECHFSDMASDLSQKLRRKMCYPCVAIDCEGFAVKGGPGCRMLCNVYDIYVLEHVRDTGDQDGLRQTMGRTRVILHDILRRMMRDKERGMRPVAFFEVSDAEGFPVTFKEMALYGWGLSVIVPEALNSHICNDHFER